MKTQQVDGGFSAPIPRALVKLLIETPNLAADDALLAALSGAELARATQIVEILLSRSAGDGARQLIAVFHTLG
jgi:hypothetical protein